jgi:hypothetical protein
LGVGDGALVPFGRHLLAGGVGAPVAGSGEGERGRGEGGLHWGLPPPPAGAGADGAAGMTWRTETGIHHGEIGDRGKQIRMGVVMEVHDFSGNTVKRFS